jgi:hypothetical protein
MIETCAENLKELTIDKHVAKIICKPAFPSLRKIFEESPEKKVLNKIGEEIQTVITKMEEARNRIGETYKETAEQINNTWASTKLDIVPGDLLLDEVCKKYGVRFIKGLGDGARLAAKMRPSEIPLELQEMIAEIVK